MQKRVRKNSEYICPKKPKLEIAINNDSEKSEGVAMPSQYEPPKVEVDIQSESMVRGASSVSCSDVNITEKSPVLVNSIMKTFAKSEILETDVVQLKEVPQKMLKTDENEHVQQCPVEITSDNPNKNISAASILPLQENTASLQESVSLTKLEVESVQALSNYKLLQNDGAGEFETSAAEENTNNKPPSDGSSPILISAKNEQLTNNTKESLPLSVQKTVEPLPMNPKAGDDVAKGNLPNMLGSNLSLPSPAQLEPNSTGEKKKPGDQSTAKVSIGNTTISVPLLPFRRIITKEGKSNIVRKVINIHGKKMKAPTIVQLSQVNLTPKTSAKIVQATLVGNKIQLPNMGFKSSGGYLKSNFVNPSTMNVTSLPKQIFEDEMVYVEKPQQPQVPPSEEAELKTIESPSVGNVMNKAPGNHKEDIIPKSSPSYLAQVCVIESDSTAPSKTFESSVTDSLPSSITVASTSESTLTRVTPSMSKAVRKPLMVTKALTPSEVSTTGEILKSANANNDSTASKDNPQLASKLLEDNILLRKQFAIAVQNCNKFQLKVTKRTDDMKPRPNEVSISQPRRQMSQMAKTGPIGGQSSGADTVLVTNVEKIEKVKSDDTQNVLLKHLLQSSISQRSNAACNQTMAPRKLATVRAPSLGVVSSLEAQLARPVIPPVSSVGDHKSESKMPPKNGNDKMKKAPIDRESAPIKTRPEMISRETSFVSTFSPKPKNHSAAPPPDYERVTNMPPTTIQQQVETEAPKAVQYQQTATNTNYNINVFKFFKEKEQSKTVGRPVESNANSMQNNLLSPDHNSDTKMSIKNEYDSTTHSEAASSPTIKAKLTKMDSNEDNVEMRKRFKRDYQKHKRQMVLNKDAPNQQKKKSRKLSKACEDFDEFIENKVVQMKQMFVLEVLEPLLSTFLGICSVYGYNDKMRNQVEHAYHNVFKEDFGKTNLKNLVDFYGVKPYGPGQSSKVSNVPSFQNKFYDEEFSTMSHDSCDKLFQFISTLKQQSLQSSENISLVSSPQPANELRLQAPLDVSYPGIKFEQSFELDDDRMSPVIPFISANHFGEIRRRKPNHANRKKCSFGSTEKTIRLKLSSFLAENLLDILRDLENLLNVYSPVSYKLLNNDKLNVRNIKGLYLSRIKNLQRTESTNIQNFLNGTYKCCRKCHLIIICGIVGADSNSNIKKRILSDSHFCDKYCCIQYQKKSGRKYVVSRKRERSFPNNKQPVVNRISAIENNNCYNSSNYKVFSPNCFWKPAYKANAGEDVNDICMKMRVAITLNTNKDTRRCILCNQKGDSFAEGSSRLLNYDVNKWVHLNCALWSNSVYETINGGLMNLELTMQQGLHQVCTYCNQYGASIKCFKMRCSHTYHLPCAIKEQCVFYKNKTIHCASHAHRMEKKNELSSIRVRRRVYIERDENRQVAAVMHHLELSNLLRIGNLTFINVGQLLPHQLEAFHTPNFIYPIGYKIIRFFWSMKKLNKRCRYICSIAETNGRPEFVIQVQEPCEPDVELRDISPRAVWKRVLEKIVLLRKGQPLVQFFAEFMNGEDLFGLSEPSIVRILESLPGVESLTDYRFKYGRNPLLELPLAVNPSGSARTEPKQRHIINWKKAHTQRTSSINLKLSLSPSSLVAGEVACPYSKQFVHSKSSQYRKMKQEWRNNVYLARSKIQGLGLYAARDLEKHTMVIEYIGQVIRTEVSELREKQYDLRNRGIYMFRLDEERVVDATLSGGLARYINHSCNPNCVTEIVDVDREYRIIIFAKRRINKGEELSYDYKFDIEDDANKISCMCDAPNCRKWMN